MFIPPYICGAHCVYRMFFLIHRDRWPTDVVSYKNSKNRMCSWSPRSPNQVHVCTRAGDCVAQLSNTVSLACVVSIPIHKCS